MQPKRLDSWKEIAGYLARSVATAQRWEREEGLPVHRHVHRTRGSVFAYEGEIDDWLASRAPTTLDDAPPSAASGQTASAPVRFSVLPWIGAAGALAVLAGLTAWSRAGLPELSSNTQRPVTAVAFTSFAGSEQNPTFSPDGSEIAFSWNGRTPHDYDIYIRSVATGSIRRVTSNPLLDKAPKWSPTEDRIAFVRGDGVSSTKDVLVLDLETETETLVTTLRHSQRYGAFLDWSSDGESLLVNRRSTADEPLRIERIELATGQATVLTDPKPGTLGDLYFAMSPDDRNLALARCEADGPCDIFVQDLGSGELHRLTNDVLYIEGVCWTPDGQEVIFASGRGGHRNLWRVPRKPADTPSIAPVTFHTGAVLHPAIGRAAGKGGFRIAYQRIFGEENIWRTGPTWPADSESIEQVVVGAGSRMNVALSPSEDKLAFRSDESGYPEIWIYDFGSVAPWRLTQLASGGTSGPAWFPHDERIVFAGAGDIWSGRWKTGGLDRLTNTPWKEHHPKPDPVRDRIYFISYESGSGQIWKQELSGEPRLTQLTTGGASDLAVDSTGSYVYFTKYADTPAQLWRIHTEGGRAEFLQDGVRAGGWTLKNDMVYFLDFRDQSAGRYLPRDVLRFDPISGALERLGTIPKQGDHNLLIGFDYGPQTGRFYWIQRDTSFQNIWVDDFR